ncbi:hypothetical protein SAMN05192564_1166 [Paraburkholderia sartisoli]|uniref:Uncharacterized protein n=1 Tax=Paraburkholderia sartisoli TaxID=83784 RepID=A0A1H4HTV1_9BURK|nr:hypothetical protein SAMN05192564_1166 [Paraburkholderia sartisoli]
MYPVVFFDAPRVKIHEEGLVRNKATYLAPGLGSRDPLPCVSACGTQSDLHHG